jgi:NAD(P)H-hydrate repair Nnr-like enzyme with NAD(P)H-hydrate dehydratase domain
VHAIVERSGVPLVVDADALNAFAGDPDRLPGATAST